MAKTYEQKLKAYKAQCLNHAHLALLYMQFEINSERPESAGKLAVDVARWGFMARPDLREEV